MEKQYTIIQAAETLGITVRTVRDWIKRGTLKAHKYKGKNIWYIPQSSIDRLQQEMTSEE